MTTAGPRILLVSFLFPPYSGIGAVRVGKLASFLAAKGWEIRALAGQAPEPRTLDPVLSEDFAKFTPWFEVDRALDWLIPNWYREKNSAASTGPSQDGADSGSGGLRSHMRRVYCELTRYPDSRIGWYRNALDEGSRMLEAWRPDLIYASSPPMTGLLVADALSRRHGIPWVAEFRDLWTDNPYYEYSRIRRLLEKRHEQSVVRRAAAIVTVSEPWRDVLVQRFKRPTAVVMNGYVFDDFPSPPPLTPETSGPVRILYTGHIYPGYRDPSALFSAIAQLGDHRSRVRVEFVGTSRDSLGTIARQYGVEDCVRILPSVSYRDSLGLQAQADVLLNLQSNHPREVGWIPAKVFEYIAARRPILSLGYESSRLAGLIRERDAGLVTNDPRAIAEQILKWSRMKEQGGIPPIPESATAGLSRVEQFQKLEPFLLEVLREGSLRPSARFRPPRIDPTGLTRARLFKTALPRTEQRPSLTILVDTEEDFDWGKSFSRTNYGLTSLSSLRLAHEIFIRYGAIPSYLLSYPVAASDVGQEIFRDWVQAEQCVVGAQLHPWVNPPLSEEVTLANSYPGNLTVELEREKLEVLTQEIMKGCGVRPLVYRAGRYGLGPNTPKILEDLGYLVDTSLLPVTNLSATAGLNFAEMRYLPFFFGQNRPLLELPVTREFTGSLRAWGPFVFHHLQNSSALQKLVLGAMARTRTLERITLTPEGITFDELRRLTETLLSDGHRILTFSLHSPSLLPGATPYVSSQEDLRKFLSLIERFLDYFAVSIGGVMRTPLEIYRSLTEVEGGAPTRAATGLRFA